jgi:sulfatase maturation enzyme AslB (radical SAM superfamily)
VYFAGGEPMMMEEHYRILKELVKREMFDVKLIYNTNFSRLTLKDDNVLDLWRLFNNVSVGASLDGMSAHGEYIRKGTKWDQIVRNREEMIKRCPNTDFYVSSTVSLYNAMHVADFHRSWTEQGLVKAQDWNINILQGPDRDRIDVLPQIYKDQVTIKVKEHIEWLRPQDHLQRATSGYEGMLNFMNVTDNSHLLKEFFRVNDVHDAYRKERFEDIFLEYKELRNYATT